MAAARPSRRRHRATAGWELRLLPVLSLLMILVPMLLQTAVFEQTAAIQVTLPSADEVRYLDRVDPQTLAESLTLALTDEGFLLASGEAKLAVLPRLGDGRFDFPGLDRALQETKNRYSSQEALVLLVEDQVIYDEVVHTMDRCRPFFPDVSLADRVEVGQEE